MKKFIVLFLLFAGNLAAQDFRVSGFTLNSAITIENPVDLDIGRYEVYEFYLEKGDHYSIELKSEDFWPGMFLVTPSKEFIITFAKDENVVSIDSVSTETGNWEVYVISDTTQMGSFTLTTNFCDRNSFNLKNGADFCDGITFYSAHSENDFHFLKSKSMKTFEDIESVEIQSNLVSANYKDTEDFLTLRNRIKSCLGSKWLWKNETNRTLFSEIGSSKRVELTEKNGSFKISFYKQK